MTAPAARPVTELPRTVPVGLARRTLRAVQRFRTTFVFGVVLVLFGALLVRLGRLQLFSGADYRELVARQRSVDDVKPLRGAIVDRAGRVLALSRPVRHVLVEAGGVVLKSGAIKLTVDDVSRFAVTLSELLEGVPSAKELREAVQARRRDGPFGRSGTSQIVVRRNIDDPRIVARLDEARTRLPGLVVLHADRRDYPNGSWGGHLIGVARTGDAWGAPTGLDGVERGLEEFLRGETVRRSRPVDGRGRPFVTPRSVDPRDDADGRTAWLAMDLVVQGFCEEALDELMAAWAPKGAVAIVMDPANGDVLAMAQRPAFDPSVPSDEAGQDLATQWTTEPGSTFKPFTFARALDAGVLGPAEPLEMPRSREFTVRGSTTVVRDAHEGESAGPGTVVDACAHSNNPDAALAAFRLEASGMQRLLADLGVEAKFPVLGIPESREAKGYIPWKRLGATDHLRWGFGHAFTMTPLRLAASYCAFARDDFRPVTPRVVLAVGGETVREGDLGPVLVRDPAKRAVMRRALRAVVTEGTAVKAFAGARVDVSGKTGTARKPVGEGYYSCSFAGFAPADAPRLVCLVMAQEPSVRADGAKPYGGAVAAPAVRHVLERTLIEYFGVAPKDAPEHVVPAGPASDADLPASASPRTEDR